MCKASSSEGALNVSRCDRSLVWQGHSMRWGARGEMALDTCGGTGLHSKSNGDPLEHLKQSPGVQCLVFQNTLIAE